MKWEFRTEKWNTKVKNLMDRLNSGTEETAERIRKLEDRSIRIIQSEEQKKNEQGLRDSWDAIKHTNRYITGILEEDRETK